MGLIMSVDCKVPNQVGNPADSEDWALLEDMTCCWNCTKVIGEMAAARTSGGIVRQKLETDECSSHQDSHRFQGLSTA